MKRLPVVLVTFLLLALFLAACNNVPAPPAADPADGQASVDAAVEATLTAVAESDQGEHVDATPQAGPTDTVEPDPESLSTPAAPGIVVPPIVPDFQPAERPITSKGDPEAPVVIYEWSDYT